MYREGYQPSAVIQPEEDEDVSLAIPVNGKAQTSHGENAVTSIIQEEKSLSPREQAKKVRSELWKKRREKSRSLDTEKQEKSRDNYNKALLLIRSDRLDPSFKRDLLSYWEFRDEMEERFSEMVALKKEAKKGSSSISEDDIAGSESRWKDAKMWFEALQHEVQPKKGDSEAGLDDIDPTLTPDLFVRKYVHFMNKEHADVLKKEIREEVERLLAIQLHLPEFKSITQVASVVGHAIENKIMSKKEMAEAAVPAMAKLIADHYYKQIEHNADRVINSRLAGGPTAPLCLEINEQVCREAGAAMNGIQEDAVNVFKLVQREGCERALLDGMQHEIVSKERLDVQGGFDETLKKVKAEETEFLGYRLPVARNFTGNPHDPRSGCEVHIDNKNPHNTEKVKPGQARISVVFGEKISSNGTPNRTELSKYDDVGNPSSSLTILGKFIKWLNVPKFGRR